MTENERQQWRRQLRTRRQQLSETEQREASEAVSQRLLTFTEQRPQVQEVAVFLANDSEINLQPYIEALWQRNIKTLVPVLHPFCAGHLLFMRYADDTVMRPNRFSIPEPELACPNVVPLAKIDLLLAPLVGFDGHGNRLGMGGGFYDRTLNSWFAGRYPNLQVAGVAHDCQYVEQLPAAAWDIPLPRVFTPTREWQF
ncbi:MAG: 5-formyltetrahydrofolate cyclo-ligase [Aliidiomarina sp.]|uniref:5-formyltetrahydrofolate cyclo-ligase n=1 Tax=Aliidiomarina sp. TaxID=1872439 RepID=UPI0025BA9F74|nr:5-formyltetrahydrofolate cyclo-ligase [Aliidiomarina sp.]MCH8501908.1 5-formyltetrahydrofolate cyclo-ligase [Aliidiomarina sp.]